MGWSVRGLLRTQAIATILIAQASAGHDDLRALGRQLRRRRQHRLHGLCRAGPGGLGLTWNQALETGGVLVGKQVRIEIEAEATQQ